MAQKRPWGWLDMHVCALSLVSLAIEIRGGVEVTIAFDALEVCMYLRFGFVCSMQLVAVGTASVLPTRAIFGGANVSQGQNDLGLAVCCQVSERLKEEFGDKIRFDRRSGAENALACRACREITQGGRESLGPGSTLNSIV